MSQALLAYICFDADGFKEVFWVVCLFVISPVVTLSSNAGSGIALVRNIPVSDCTTKHSIWITLIWLEKVSVPPSDMPLSLPMVLTIQV